MDSVSLAPASATITSPKLTKKPSLGDIRQTLGSDRKVYGCDHCKDLLSNAQQEAIKQYTRLVQAIYKNSGITTRLPKSASSLILKPTYLCLQCPNVATIEQRDRHDKGHRFCAESTSGRIYCRECKDHVYDPSFEEIRAQRGRKRKFNAFLSDVDNKILAANSGPTPCRASALRGLYNMGQTCFMSVVVQSLVHNPFIRAYYLAEGHRSADCERETCMSCCLDEIFSEFHSTEKAEGYGLVALLQASWRTGGSLAGYQQQDAHEFLQFTLNSLHSANIEDGEKEEKAEDCHCVIHQTFGGLLQSTVTCSKCHNVTTALDPFMDLSLDVRKEGHKKKNHDNDKKKDKSNIALHPPPAPAMKLNECLDRFTSPETLPATDYTCRLCGGPQSATKRLGLSRIPPVLPMHLKRFSHGKNSNVSVKLDTKVRFPLTLDLTPYAATSASSSTKKKKNREKEREKDKDKDKDKDPNGITTNGEDKKSTDPPGENKDADDSPSRPIYELSSVIVHKGKMDSGHYVSFSRVNDEWFMFDDSKVVLVEEGDVLASEAYMLFYVVREIDV